MGMDEALYSTILTSGAWANLTTRAKWRLSGGDRVRYLNGQVTNDIRTARADRALLACVTNAKGRVEAEIRVHTTEDALFLDAPAELREALGARLERYIIADDAVLEDVTEDWQLWHWTGPSVAPETGFPEGSRKLASSRFGLSGLDFWVPAGAGAVHPQGPVLSESDMECLRIVQRVPGWPAELNPEVFPPEAGLEESAMSFTKGCYIGQEVLSRIKTTRKMPRELIAWTVGAEVEESTLKPGSSIWLGDKEVGTLTSVTRHPASNRLTGLGYVRQGMASADSVLLVGNGPASIAARLEFSALLTP